MSAAESPRLFCHGCGAENHPDTRFCHHCGRELAAREAAPPPRERGHALVRSATVALAAVALLLAGAAYLSSRSDEPGASPAQLAALDESVKGAGARSDATAHRVTELGKQVDRLTAALSREQEGLAPVAARALRSVVTIDAGDSAGTAFAAWKSGGTTYLITARHVVEDNLAKGVAAVRLTRKEHSWPGRVVAADSVNDLALVRTSGDVGPPLWPRAATGTVPAPGDQLLLVGSPYGLEGTVTTGIVSRVSYNEIQTDAAANPGNSGGPALDRAGRIVGVLLAGEGQDLNFTVPIERACVALRSC
jgi:putative serine protease PepD